MSRTDNTDPFPIRLANANMKPGRRVVWHSMRLHRDGECDIHLDPIILFKNVPVNSRRTECGITVPYSEHVSGIPRWFRKAKWYGPERQRELVELNNMRREYNYYGHIVADDFPDREGMRDLWWDWY